MGGWTFPSFIHKGVDPTQLDDAMLVYYHDNLHILWNKLEEGYHFEWTFLEIYKLHHAIVKAMNARGIPHYAPINELDKVQFFSKIVEPIAYSVEKKMNGFHVSVHKKGNEVKIFSEQKKDLTKAFPTLIKAIQKLSTADFIIDGELVPYDEKGNALGRDALMKYTGAVKSGKQPDDHNIKLHVWDIPYFNKPLIDLPLIKRIDYLDKLHFNDRVKEIERKIIRDKKDLKKAIQWAASLKDSEGTVVKDLNSTYHFGEHSSWKKFRNLTPLIVKVLEVIPKKGNVYNYLVGIKADKKYLDKNYIQDGYLILGHTFNTSKIFNKNDKIKILVEEVWRHETNKGIHYSIHKPRVDDLSDEKLTTVDDLEDIVTSIGVAVTHHMIDNMDVIKGELRHKPEGEGKEIEVKDFPEEMQESFKNMIGKWNDYVLQVHTRGKTLHYDLRHKVNNHLEGITLFGRSTEDRLPIETQRNNIRSTVKLPQPVEWLTFEGITKRGYIGATKHYPGIFTIISKGKYTVHDVSDHKIVLEYKSDKGKINKQMLKWAGEHNLPYAHDLPDKLIDLTGKYSWHIAHIGDHHIILFDKLKGEQNGS